jgi:hypothetical protein
VASGESTPPSYTFRLSQNDRSSLAVPLVHANIFHGLAHELTEGDTLFSRAGERPLLQGGGRTTVVRSGIICLYISITIRPIELRACVVRRVACVVRERHERFPNAF